MATTTPNFGWSVPTSSDLVKNGATAIETLGDSIDASLVDLKGGTTGQVLAKASDTDMDFSWVAQDDSNAIQNALLTTTGDTIYASGASTPARLGIGTTGQVLTVAGGVPSWATPAAGGGGKVLQVVMGTLTGITSTTSSSLVDLGLSVSITPSSASSKVLIITGVNMIAKNSGNAGTAMKLSLLRGATSIMNCGDRNGFNNTNVYSNVASATLNYLDTPATTSATTYKIQFASSVSGQGVYVNDYDSSNATVSTIIALEIGA